jgi:hypothetical protein
MHHHWPILHLLPHANHKPPTNYPSNFNKSHTTYFPYQPLTFHVNVGSQLYIFLNPLNHAQLGHFSAFTLLVPTIGHDHTPQPTCIFSTHPQSPPKVLCPDCGCQFTTWSLAHHQDACQTYNSSNPNPCDDPDLIPSLTPTSPPSTWTCVLTLDVLRSIHLGLHCLQWYNCIPTILWHDVQVAFCFPLNKLVQDPYNVVVWHLFLLLPQWCLILPLHVEVMRHKEMHIPLKCFLTSN